MNSVYSIFPSLLLLAGAVFLRAEETNVSVYFDIPGGRADTGLNAFTQQSALQLIYPTALLDEVHTHAVSGILPPRIALEQMLAGTGIAVRQDSETGAFSLGRWAPAEQVVLLPPFIVDESIAGRWRYAAAPGLEVLSRCPDEVTQYVAAQYYRLHEMLEIILPKHLQFRSDVATTCLLFDKSGYATVPQEVVSSLARRSASLPAAESSAGEAPGMKARLVALPSYRFTDREAVALFFIWEPGAGQLRLTSDYLKFLMEKRSPALPEWFIEGMLEVYRSTTITVDSGLASSGTPYANYTITVGPEVSSQKAALGKANVAKGVRVIGLEEFLSTEMPMIHQSPIAVADAASERRASAAWFIRWGLENKRRREALWTFVDHSAAEGSNEELFTQSFGMNFAKANVEMNRYRRHHSTAPLVLHPDRAPILMPVVVRPATTGEVGRIKGGFDRLEISYVDRNFPQLSERYIAQARRTLRKAYDAGDRDPRLLVEIGLCECDSGNDPDAVRFLEKAIEQKVARSRAYFELGRIRFEDARSDNLGRKLSRRQALHVLQPLFQMQDQSPPLEEAYELMANTWLAADATPTAEQLDFLIRGLGHFPKQGRLVYSVASVHAKLGQIAAARTVLERGLKMSSHPQDQARLRTLLASLPPR